jgi:hypothetical protein
MNKSIIIHPTGQMCNQFWILSNYIADCIEEDRRIAVWLPDFNLNEFDNLVTSQYVTFPLYPNVIIQSRFFSSYQKLINKIFRNKIALWMIRAILSIIPSVDFEVADVTCKKSKYKYKHLDKILSILEPKDQRIKKLNQIFKEKTVDSDSIIIGVHIRYGDYRFMSNGQYFYSLQQYRQKMIEIQSLFDYRNVIFFIATNEKLDLTHFDGLNIFQIQNGVALDDLFGLSLCNYILGPPSTFSAWASLFNQTPLYFIEDINIPIVQDKFIDIKKLWF